MWSYQQYSRSNDIVHFGVKGMKWGVRRDIGMRSREYARMEIAGKKAVKSYNRVVEKIKNRTNKLGTGDAINRDLKLTKLLDLQDRGLAKLIKMDKYMDRLYQGLSEKDLAQGRRQVNDIFRNAPIMLPFNLADSAKARRIYGGDK